MNDATRHEDHERLRDDLAAYALGALGEGEAADLQRHLEGCESCRARLQWLTPAIDVLPAAVPQESPPEALRERLMETVRDEAAPPARATRERRPARAPWLSFVLRPATALAATALIAAGVGVGYVVADGDDPAAPASETLKAEALTSNVSATLELHGDSGTLHVNQMPELDPDEVYEVWVQRAGVMEPASLFVLDSKGAALAAVPGPLENAEAIAVTVEPSGGSQSPTTDPLLQAELS